MSFGFKTSLARNAGWMLLGQSSVYGLRVICFLTIARLLGVAQYGVVVGAFALVSLAAPYSRVGTGTVLLRYVAPNHHRALEYLSNTFTVTLLMGGIVVALLVAIAPHIIDPLSASIIAFMAVGSCLFEQLTTGVMQVFQAVQSMRLSAGLGQLTALFRTVAAVGMLAELHHATARQWAIASVLASAAAAIICVGMAISRFGWPQFLPRLAWKHGAEGLGYAFACSTIDAYDDLDKTMLSHYGMDDGNGVYGLAYRVIQMGTAPLISIQLATDPRLFQLAAGDPQGAISLGRRVLSRALLITSASTLCMFVFAPLLTIAAGRGFADAAAALRWVCVIPLFRCIHWTSGGVLTAIGLQPYRTTAQVAVVIFNYGLNLWLIPAYGWHGAAWASLATDGMLAILTWSIVERRRRLLVRMPAEEVICR